MPALAKKKSPQKVGKYTIGRLLGAGAFGEVYYGSTKDGSVAIKILDSAAARDSEILARFKREAETAQRLDHPNIVRVHEVGSSRGKHYLVMDLVAGGSLRDLLRRGAPPEVLLSVLTDTASALAHAHAEGVIHRDVKPENVLLTRTRRARVADFGLARTMDQTSMTTDGRLLGTALYMSPEQCRGGKATGASDVYAMGIMIYEAICGKRPFDAEQTVAVMYQHAEVPPPPPKIHHPFPPSLGALALECLAKNPGDRPTMVKVAERLSETRLLERSRFLSWPWLTGAAVAALVVLTILVPSVLSPLCGDWFGGGAFRGMRRGARAVHHAIFGGEEHHKLPARRADTR